MMPQDDVRRCGTSSCGAHHPAAHIIITAHHPATHIILLRTSSPHIIVRRRSSCCAHHLAAHIIDSQDTLEYLFLPVPRADKGGGLDVELAVPPHITAF
ncbi:unnamed protein product [Pleuronectes platessa]|uniref:Uncharacterized protein n=1 Tax=Pleuronectes platessa TaxID=8262 RepID=A0A9N7ZCH3_PLEPL|nr:unnamed protein product [Pleuronectes platessa]